LFSWLVTLPGGSEFFSEYADKMNPAKRAIQSGDLEQGMRLYIDSFMGSGVSEQLPTSVRERITANQRLIGAEPTAVSEVGPDITREQAATIQAPTLMLTGDESPKMFLLVSQELARYLPKVEQAQISEASHLLHVMNPQAYNAIVPAFLAKHADKKE
jgi:pimeloyl-ACP methyl ester carboxylesterase